MNYFTSLKTVIGDLYIISTDNEIIALCIGKSDFQDFLAGKEAYEDSKHPLLIEAVKQLDEYFAGKRREFQLPLKLEGTKFQQKVWLALMTIPYGEVRNYQEIAEQIGNKKAVRAVGQANRRNPLPIIVPCHRVIGKNGTLTGYAGSRLDIKEILLELEYHNYKDQDTKAM